MYIQQRERTGILRDTFIEFVLEGHGLMDVRRRAQCSAVIKDDRSPCQPHHICVPQVHQEQTLLLSTLTSLLMFILFM